MITVLKVNKSGNKIDSYDCKTDDGRVVPKVKKEELIPYIAKGLVDNARIQIIVDDAPREVEKPILDKSQLTLTNVAAWLYNNVCPITSKVGTGAYMTKEIDKKYNGYYYYITLRAGCNKDIKLEFRICEDGRTKCIREYKWDMKHKVFIGRTFDDPQVCRISRTEVLSPKGLGKIASAYDKTQFVDDNGNKAAFMDRVLQSIPTEILVGSFLDNADEMMKYMYSTSKKYEKSYEEEQRIKRMGKRA